ncbi:MAG: SRPBCC family protein [Anaerolineales bacterium]|uniref:SRPBCC family protein n=1 Tax=Promineifilum sp. TaxID=2664178 RepID=UPI001D6E392D|nr:SRPBCC family protein [Anaerolineales bacterium]MCB8936455.1 SRPBCC family protein [Promineifilum sp.]MCO5178586.1 SRPBCC family protein [Promineifilum sp.]
MSDRVTKTITVNGDLPAIYNIWANFEAFPYFMKYVNKVTKTGPRTSHWEVAGPMGVNLEWDAETTRLDPNQRIAWNTKDHDGSVTTSGDVVFAELPDNQTRITVTMNYSVPGGKVGAAVAQLFSNPDNRLEEDLRNFKAYAENGRSS